MYEGVHNSIIDKVTGVVISSLKDSLLVRWNRSISNDIDLYFISYRIGNQLMDNTSVAMDTTSLSIPINETGRYTISVSAAVVISGGKIIIGDANTLYGTYMYTYTYIYICDSCVSVYTVVSMLIHVPIAPVHCYNSITQSHLYTHSTGRTFHRYRQLDSSI